MTAAVAMVAAVPVRAGNRAPTRGAGDGGRDDGDGKARDGAEEPSNVLARHANDLHVADRHDLVALVKTDAAAVGGDRAGAVACKLFARWR